MDLEFLLDLDKRANPGAFSHLDAEILVPEVQKLEPGEVYLEVGVDKGKSLSIAKMVAKEGVKVIGVDLREDPKVEGTIFYHGDSVQMAKQYKEGEISVLFIDGDHSYKGCKRDIKAWVPKVKPGGVILFHDCDESSPGVMWAVAEFVCNTKGKFRLFKYNNKNTSMAKVTLWK